MNKIIKKTTKTFPFLISKVFFVLIILFIACQFQGYQKEDSVDDLHQLDDLWDRYKYQAKNLSIYDDDFYLDYPSLRGSIKSITTHATDFHPSNDYKYAYKVIFDLDGEIQYCETIDTNGIIKSRIWYKDHSDRQKIYSDRYYRSKRINRHVYFYNDQGLPIGDEVLDEYGNTFTHISKNDTISIYSSENLTGSYRNYVNGKKVQFIKPNEAESSFTYHSNGVLKSIIAEGYSKLSKSSRTRYERYKFYDSLGRKKLFCHRSSNGNRIQKWIYDDNDFDIEDYINVLNSDSIYVHNYKEGKYVKENMDNLLEYDSHGNIIKERYVNELIMVYKYEYDNIGNWIKQEEHLDGRFRTEIKRSFEYYSEGETFPTEYSLPNQIIEMMRNHAVR